MTDFAAKSADHERMKPPGGGPIHGLRCPLTSTRPTSRDLFVSARDGLRLYARDLGPLDSRALPVVCLPGLARTSADFHSLAAVLASDETTARRVIAVDYRGRGRSEWDPDWRRYDVRVELEDVLQVLTAAGVEEAIFVGTSRGGLISMGLGAVRPTLLRGVVLNDIGPVVDPRGLVRIRSYIGKLPTPRDFREAAENLRRISEAQFPAWADTEWEILARGTWTETEGRLMLAYDPKLMETVAAMDMEASLPNLWPLFEGLNHVPVLVLRGEHSDILGAETLQRMSEVHPMLEAVTVPGQGHAPLLEGDLIKRIARFVTEIEERHALPSQCSAVP
jgi:pimeloyl-ACP methyl ester carboxylesterase